MKILRSGLHVEIFHFGMKPRAELILVEHQALKVGLPENPGHDVNLDTGFSLGIDFSRCRQQVYQCGGHQGNDNGDPTSHGAEGHKPTF